MMVMRALPAVCLVAAALVSRAEGQTTSAAAAEPAYDGRPMSAWVAQLEDAAPQIRSAAAYALAGIGPAAKGAVPALSALLADEGPNVRYAAAWALGEIGRAAEGAIPALTRALEDEHVDVRWSARKALKKIRGT